VLQSRLEKQAFQDVQGTFGEHEVVITYYKYIPVAIPPRKAGISSHLSYFAYHLPDYLTSDSVAIPPRKAGISSRLLYC